jgi:hypothetical protein
MARYEDDRQGRAGESCSYQVRMNMLHSRDMTKRLMRSMGHALQHDGRAGSARGRDGGYKCRASQERCKTRVAAVGYMSTKRH